MNEPPHSRISRHHHAPHIIVPFIALNTRNTYIFPNGSYIQL